MFAGTTSKGRVSAPAWTEAGKAPALIVGVRRDESSGRVFFSANAAPEKSGYWRVG